MKYISENRLMDFVFHDSEMSLKSFEDGKLVLKAEFLNLSKDSPQNPHGNDMQLDKAEIAFEGFGVNSVTDGSWWNEYEDEESEEDYFSPRFSVSEEALDEFVRRISDNIRILEFGIESRGYHYLNAEGKDGWFSAKFLYYNVTISWDEFLGIAWYEKKRR